MPKIIQLNMNNKIPFHNPFAQINENIIFVFCSFSDFKKNTKRIIDNALSKRDEQINKGCYKIQYDLHNKW